MQKIRLGRGVVYPACKSNRQIGICYSLLFLKTIISPTIPTIIPIIANGKSLKLANTVRFISALLALKSIPNRITAIPFNLLSFILFISITFDLFIRFPVYHMSTPISRDRPYRLKNSHVPQHMGVSITHILVARNVSAITSSFPPPAG